jgi:hypothetical protein
MWGKRVVPRAVVGQRRPIDPQEARRSDSMDVMKDLMVVLFVIVLFGLSCGFVKLCERL